MQERPPYKITPEQGWSHMQALLDKSMPVAYRSRRFLIFWWTTTAAVISLLATLFLLKEDTQTKTPPSAITTPTGIANIDTRTSNDDHTSPAADLKYKNESNTNDIATTSQIKNSATSEKKTNPISAANKSVTKAKNPILQINKNNTGSPAQQASNNKVAETESIASSHTINLPQTDQQETPDVNNEIDISKTGVTVIEEYPASDFFLSNIVEVGTIRRNYPSLDFLLPVEVAYEISDNNIDLIQPGTLSTSHKKHAFRPDISMGAMAGSQNGLGLNGSIGVDYSLNARLSLTGGVGLSTYNPGALINKNESNQYSDQIVRTDNNYAETYIVAEKLNSATDYEAINPYVKSIRQWEIHAGMKYALAKRFFIEGGLTLGLGTTAKSEYPIVTFGAIPTADINVETFFNSYDILRSSMTSVYGSLGYHVSRHFSISLEWRHGLNHYLLNEQSNSLISDPLISGKRTDYIRGLNLSIGYTL